MAIQTKLQLVQEILYEAYGGITSSDTRISERFVLTKVNNKIASLAMTNAFNLTNLEGITYADDFFYITFNDLPVTLDTRTGYYVLTLPAQPIGLPRERSYSIYPNRVNNCTGMDSTLFKMMPRHEVQRMNSLPTINKVFCFVQDGKINMKKPKNMPLLEIESLDLVMATADGGLTSNVNLPQDMIDNLKASTVKELRAIILGVPMDIKNDGIEITEPRV